MLKHGTYANVICKNLQPAISLQANTNMMIFTESIFYQFNQMHVFCRPRSCTGLSTTVNVKVVDITVNQCQCILSV